MWTGLDKQSSVALKTEESRKLQKGAIRHQQECEHGPGLSNLCEKILGVYTLKERTLSLQNAKHNQSRTREGRTLISTFAALHAGA